MCQVMLHRRAPLTIRVPRIMLATTGGDPRAPFLQPVAMPHAQRLLAGYPSSRITSAALCSYRSYNSAARLRCSLEYLAMMTTPPAQGVQHSVTHPDCGVSFQSEKAGEISPFRHRSCLVLVWLLHEGVGLAVGVALESDHPAVVDGAVDDRGGHVGVAEDPAPSAELDVGGVDDALPFRTRW